MRRHLWSVLRGSLNCAVLLLGLTGLAAAEPSLTLQGSTTFNSELMVAHQADIEAAARIKLKVVPNKSNVGLMALLDGTADLAMISTVLVNELDVLRRAKPDLPLDRLQAFGVARTRMAIAVHPSNSVRSISDDDLRRLLLGEVTNWQQLGGADLPIRFVAVREGGGTVTTLEAAILGAGRHILAKDQIRVSNGPQVIKVVEQEPGAFGVAQLKLAQKHRLQELTTSAPIEQQLSLVSLGDPSPEMLAVIQACRSIAAALDLD